MNLDLDTIVRVDQVLVLHHWGCHDQANVENDKVIHVVDFHRE